MTSIRHIGLLGDSPNISLRAIQHCATNAAPSFLRGQNVVVDVAELAERERKRAKANELQRVLLQQLAEKENQKLLERKRQQEEEERQEQELQRHLEAERRQIEEEQRRIQEKKEAEERRLEAVKEAIAGAQQNALAEKQARRRNLQNRSIPPPDNDPPTTVDRSSFTSTVRSEERSTSAQPQTGPIELRHAILTPCSPQQEKSTLTRSSVDAEVQTDQHPQVTCRCENNPRSRQFRQRIAATTEDSTAERPATRMSMIAMKSQTSTSTANRPLWGAHKTNAKYQSQTEKDPRFMQRRRERLRRRQKLLLEKQLHGSWPSSENSGGTAVPHERYYEALQAAAVSRYYKKAPAANTHHSHGKSIGTNQSDVELIQPIQPTPVPLPSVAPTRSQSRLMSSPPVPAVLKKIQMSNGDTASGEKHEWDNYDSTDQVVKIDKDLENLQIKEQRICTEQDKQDLLYRLSILKQGYIGNLANSTSLSIIAYLLISLPVRTVRLYPNKEHKWPLGSTVSHDQLKPAMKLAIVSEGIVQQYAVPVGGVLILAILVFTFGFKTVAEPTFDRSAGSEEKKKKQVKPKTKVKKTNVSSSPEVTGDSKKTSIPAQPKSPAKTPTKKESPKKTAKTEQTKKAEVEIVKLEKKSGEVQQKKKEPKPADFDEGDWVQAVSKKDKKKKPADGSSANASSANSPTHQAGKKADKKKKESVKKNEENKSNEIPIEKIENNVATVQEPEVKAVTEAVVVAAPVVVETEPVKPVKKEEEKANKKVTAETTTDKKEKNNNNANSKKVEKVKAEIVVEKIKETVEKVSDAMPPAVVNASEDTWQENKSKKKKKARRD
ncbi:hypothetical protein GHT06_009205 [Daphnia sinensis]|uniref:CCDC66 domain-containing protein n=1 Tax=Daphnia sinensis TaxID=1820382 RepID=A0AAD5LWK9_9CRUS|nr:hypothetical protein GHT06_009205 [Daphnia sinensis]